MDTEKKSVVLAVDRSENAEKAYNCKLDYIVKYIKINIIQKIF